MKILNKIFANRMSSVLKGKKIHHDGAGSPSTGPPVLATQGAGEGPPGCWDSAVVPAGKLIHRRGAQQMQEGLTEKVQALPQLSRVFSRKDKI